MTAAAPHVAITVVTFDSAAYIARCLGCALAQTHPSIEIIVVDNASSDATRSELAAFESEIRLVFNSDNTGFAAAQNQAIELAPHADWILTLNPDVQLAPDFVSQLVAAATPDPTVGSACGKLLALLPGGTPTHPPLLDSTGIFMTPNFRHFDRGSRSLDTGQYEASEFVFGGSGAACLYRASLIRDLSVDGEFFDSDFFAYREDADVAWRAQLLGWKCLYYPPAVAGHVRTAFPQNRRSLAAAINRHSVKNRFLLRLKNTTGALYGRFWLPVTARDLVVLGGCLFGEWSSLPAFWQVLQLSSRTLRKRRAIMRRRRASHSSVARWFAAEPVSFPAPPLFE